MAKLEWNTVVLGVFWFKWVILGFFLLHNLRCFGVFLARFRGVWT